MASIKNKETQAQQVIKALRQNGGYATLGRLYQLVDTSAHGGRFAKRPYPCGKMGGEEIYIVNSLKEVGAFCNAPLLVGAKSMSLPKKS